jgi:predicted GIY-YIG superfamily endonuclease
MPFQNSQRYDFWATNWKEVGAVYGILSEKGGLIYIGQTGNLKERMADHRSSSHCLHDYKPTWVVVEIIHDDASRLLREQRLLIHYDPPCNKA